MHYASPDGQLIPFCAYNTGPTFRHEVEMNFAMPFDEYREQVKLDKRRATPAATPDEETARLPKPY